MKTPLVLASLLLTAATSCLAQITFQKGYFIDENDHRTDCFIRNVEWLNNPFFFEYSLTDNNAHPVMTADTSTVVEFGVIGGPTYVREAVDVDLSPDLLFTNIQMTRNTLFLKVIVDGHASLYEYNKGSTRRFFFKTGNGQVQQLIYKKYKVQLEHVYVKENNTYHQQLFNSVNCEKLSLQKVKLVRYDLQALTKYFKKHNECITPSEKGGMGGATEKQILERDEVFKLNIALGGEYKRLRAMNASSAESVDFGGKLGRRISIQAEYILPYNRNKWSVLVDFGYQDFKATTYSPATIEYKSFELPVVVRHYFFLEKDLKIFLNGMVLIDIPFDSKIEYIGRTLEIASQPTTAFGLGFQKGSFSTELRFYKTHTILNNNGNWFSDYSRTSLIFSLKLF